MKIVSKILFVCFSVFFSSCLYAQDAYQVIQPVETVIKSEQYHDGSNEKQIFSSLSVNNIKNVYQVALYLKGDLLISIKHDGQGHPFAYVKLLHAQVSGDIYFRDFLIDTLLIPKAFEGDLFVYEKNQLAAKIPVEMLLTGGVIDLETLEDKLPELNFLKAEIRINRFYFSDRQLQNYMHTVSVINTYYSYNEALGMLIDDIEKRPLSRGASSAATFIAWYNINRIKCRVESHDMFHALRLGLHDPLGFIKKTERLDRLAQRAATLFSRELLKGRRGKLSDRDKYCRAYVDLSLKYMRLSKKYPPSMAAAFTELAYIFPVQQELLKMSNVASFYDVFKITGEPSTIQRVYNYFVEEADRKLEKDQYLEALALIRNAKEMALFFSSITPLPVAHDVYVQSLDGLLSSFLRVSIMAYKARNFKMAKGYYQNAWNIYKEHAAVFDESSRTGFSFRSFVDKQTELADMLLNDKAYDEAVTLLDDARTIAGQLKLPYDLTSRYKRGYSGIYEQLVDSVAFYIGKEKKENSLDLLLSTAEFEKEHATYVARDERLISYAYLLYTKLYQQGMAKLNGKEPEAAIYDLKEAKRVNEIFFLQKDAEMDSLIHLAMAPVILRKVKKAEFEVWANRLDNALILEQEVRQMQQQYGLSENEEVLEAITSLRNKINQRTCVDLQYKTDHACQVVMNRVKSGKAEEAEKRLLQIISLLDDYPECRVDRKEPDSLINIYRPLFDYVHRMKLMPLTMHDIAAEEWISQYNELTRVYKEYALSHYLPEPQPLMHVIGQYADEHFIKEALQYFMIRGNREQVFACLRFLRTRNPDPGNTKDIQKSIGRNMCQKSRGGVPVLPEFMLNDPYYKVLRKTCLKN